MVGPPWRVCAAGCGPVSVWAAWVGPGLLPLLMASPVPTVRLHDSISEEGFHYLVFDL